MAIIEVSKRAFFVMTQSYSWVSSISETPALKCQILLLPGLFLFVSSFNSSVRIIAGMKEGPSSSPKSMVFCEVYK